MPHGGYHGTVKIGNNVVQTASQNPNTGQYEISGGIDDSSRLDFNPPSGGSGGGNAQTAAEAAAAVEAKKKEIDDGLFALALQDPIKYGSKGTNFTDFSDTFGADDQKAMSMKFDRENQILNNLLIAEQQAKNREGIIRAAQQGVLNKSDLLGYDGGFFGLNIGATPSDGISGISTVQNPFTGQALPTQIKAREGLTTPQYNQFIQELYGANPELYQETFPFASGQMAKPILARIGEGIMGIPGASEIGQMGGDILGAMISPMSGIFSGKKTATPKIQYDNMGNPVGITSQSPESDGGDFDITAPKLDLGQYSAIPEEYKGFFESEFAKPVVGGMAITYVTLPDGRRIRFGNTGTAAQFRKYLESIGVTPQEEPTEKVEVETPKEEKAPFDLAQFYAGLPTFNQSPYARQGLGSYNEMLRKYFG